MGSTDYPTKTAADVVRLRRRLDAAQVQPCRIAAIVGAESRRSLGRGRGMYKRVLIILGVALASACGDEPPAQLLVTSTSSLNRTSLIALLGIQGSAGLVEVSGFCAWDSIDGSSALYVRREDADRRLTRNAFRLRFLGLGEGTDLLVLARDTAGSDHLACPSAYYTVVGTTSGPDEIWSGVLSAESLRPHP